MVSILHNSTYNVFNLYKYIFQIISLGFIYIVINKCFIFSMQKSFNNVLLLQFKFILEAYNIFSE